MDTRELRRIMNTEFGRIEQEGIVQNAERFSRGYQGMRAVMKVLEQDITRCRFSDDGSSVDIPGYIDDLLSVSKLKTFYQVGDGVYRHRTAAITIYISAFMGQCLRLSLQ